MNKTLLCHFYNEEFLLPKWLEHHTKIFDKIILLDYASNDNSGLAIEKYRHATKCEIIWMPSQNKDFGAMNVDLEIQKWEDSIEGWKMTLNVTEFLHGDFTKCTEEPKQLIIPSFMMVGHDYTKDDQFMLDMMPTWDIGIPYWIWDERAGRSFHNIKVEYPKPGRHYFISPDLYNKDFCIFHYGWFPFCEKTLNRKLQIQNRIPQYDVNNRLGWHHITTREKLIEKWEKEYRPKIDAYHDFCWSFRGKTEESIKCAL